MPRPLLPLLALSALLAAPAAARAVDNAGVFFQGPPPAASQVEPLAAGAKVRITPDGKKTIVTVVWPDVTVALHIDPAWPRDEQLAGMRAWIAKFPSEQKGDPRVAKFVAGLDKVTTCWGTVITPGFDAGGKAVRLLQALVKKSGGFFFTSANAFYDADGAYVIGAPGAPPKMGAPAKTGK